jgi:hypothetical protein
MYILRGKTDKSTVVNHTIIIRDELVMEMRHGQDELAKGGVDSAARF